MFKDSASMARHTVGRVLAVAALAVLCLATTATLTTATALGVEKPPINLARARRGATGPANKTTAGIGEACFENGQPGCAGDCSTGYECPIKGSLGVFAGETQRSYNCAFNCSFSAAGAGVQHDTGVRCMAKVGRYRRFNESGVCRPGLGAVCTAVVGCSQGRCDAATRTCILTSNGGDCIENTECASSYCDGAVRRDDDDPDDDDDESGTCSKHDETCWDLMFTAFFLYIGIPMCFVCTCCHVGWVPASGCFKDAEWLTDCHCVLLVAAIIMALYYLAITIFTGTVLTDCENGWTQDDGIHAFVFSVTLLVFLGWLATAVFWGKSAISSPSFGLVSSSKIEPA